MSAANRIPSRNFTGLLKLLPRTPELGLDFLGGIECLLQLGRIILMFLFKELIPVCGIFQLNSHFGSLFLASATSSLFGSQLFGRL